ncbi:Uncharacterised protein [uncultured archaeon]|nr:Uncharacterised protein [uncultured archaeon]
MDSGHGEGPEIIRTGFRMQPAKALCAKGGKSRGLCMRERASLREFSVSFVLLQAFPLFLLAAFAVIAGTKLGVIGINKGLAIMLVLLAGFYTIMPKLISRVFDGIIALREARISSRQRGVL